MLSIEIHGGMTGELKSSHLVQANWTAEQLRQMVWLTVLGADRNQVVNLAKNNQKLVGFVSLATLGVAEGDALSLVVTSGTADVEAEIQHLLQSCPWEIEELRAHLENIGDALARPRGEAREERVRHVRAVLAELLPRLAADADMDLGHALPREVETMAVYLLQLPAAMGRVKEAVLQSLAHQSGELYEQRRSRLEEKLRMVQEVTQLVNLGEQVRRGRQEEDELELSSLDSQLAEALAKETYKEFRQVLEAARIVPSSPWTRARTSSQSSPPRASRCCCCRRLRKPRGRPLVAGDPDEVVEEP